MSFTRKTLFPDTMPVRSDLPVPQLDGYGPQNQPWKPPVFDAKDHEHAGRRVLFQWYWSLTPQQRYEVDCAHAEAHGLPKPPVPPELAKPRKGKGE